MPMQAVQLTGHGDMDKLVYREDAAIPEPGADEVRIAVHACGMNNTDIDKNHVGNLVVVPDSQWADYGAPHAG